MMKRTMIKIFFVLVFSFSVHSYGFAYLGRIETLAIFGGLGIDTDTIQTRGLFLHPTSDYGIMENKVHSFLQMWDSFSGRFDLFSEIEVNNWDKDFAPHFYTGSVRYLNSKMNLSMYYRATWMIPTFSDPLHLSIPGVWNKADSKGISGVAAWGDINNFLYKITYNQLLNQRDKEGVGINLEQYFDVGILSFLIGSSGVDFHYDNIHHNQVYALYTGFFVKRYQKLFNVKFEIAKNFLSHISIPELNDFSYIATTKSHFGNLTLHGVFRNISKNFSVDTSYANYYGINLSILDYPDLNNEFGGGVGLEYRNAIFDILFGVDRFDKQTVRGTEEYINNSSQFVISPFSFFKIKFVNFSFYNLSDFQKNKELIFSEIDINMLAHLSWKLNYKITKLPGQYLKNIYMALQYKFGTGFLQFEFGDNGDPNSGIYDFGVEPYSISYSTVDAIAIKTIFNF